MEKPNQDYDVFRRICRKQCVGENDQFVGENEQCVEQEIEIFEVEPDEVIEEEHHVEEDEPFDMATIAEELKCMKRRIQFFQIRLKEKLASCPQKECVDFEVQLNCSENKEICALQKDHSKLQQQINELVLCCRFAKDQVEELRTRMCEKSKDILQLQETVGFLESWRKSLSNEFGKCIERFEYLKHAKAEWSDVLQKIEKQKEISAKFQKNYVLRSCYERDQHQFNEQLDCLRENFKNLCILQNEEFLKVQERLEHIESLLPALPQSIIKTKIQMEKNENVAGDLQGGEKPAVSVNQIYFGQKTLNSGKCYF